MTTGRNPDATRWRPFVDWDQLRDQILSRDGYQCQRCEYRPDSHADAAQTLHLHVLSATADPALGPAPETVVTVCRACHGVLHPEATAFDDSRPTAALYPTYDANPEVAVVNTAHPEYDPVDETIWLHHCTFDRDEYVCQRCCTRGVSPHSRMQGRPLTVTTLTTPVDHGFRCCRELLTVCRPCYRLLHTDPDALAAVDGELGPRLPHETAHPAVAQPHPPQTAAEEERAREFLFKLVLERDHQTCNRCRTRLKADPDEYPHNFVSLYTPEEEDTYDPEDYLLVCSPCYAVLDPHNDDFTQFLPYAPQHPADTAHPWVDVEKTHYRPTDLQTLRDETIHDIFTADEHQCQRCAARGNDPENLVAYPTFNADADVVVSPFDDYTTLCRPCGSVVWAADDQTTIADLHTLDAVDLTADEFEAAAAGAPPTPTYPVADDRLDVDRGPVNRKETLLTESWLQYPHMAWQLGGTAGLALGGFFAALPTVQAVTAGGLTNPVTGGPISLWIESLGALAIVALLCASIVRWGIADLSERGWRLVDSTIEPHHYQVNAVTQIRRLIHGYVYLFGLPYLALIALHALFTILITVTVLI